MFSLRFLPVFLALGVLFFIGGCGTGSSTQEAIQEETQEAEDVEAEESHEETAEKPANEQKVEEEPDEVEVLALDPEKTKEVYLNDVKPELGLFMSQFDDIWETQWRPTLQKLSEGSISDYEAYKQIDSVRDQYEQLSLKISKYTLPDGIDEEKRKLLNAFLVDMEDASFARREAAKLMMKMIDQGDYSPSNLDKVQERIDSSDYFMLQAVASLVDFENQLGIEKD